MYLFCYSLELCIQMGISFLFSFDFCFSSQPILMPPETTALPFAFLFLGIILITTACTVLQTSIYSSSGSLSDLIPCIYLSLPLYNCKGFDLGHI